MRYLIVNWVGIVGALFFAMSSMAAPPNVLIILADDLGFSDIGCYGGEIETPNLNALAAGGIRYTQFYNTARCWPTRAAPLTGYYAQQVGFDTLPGAAKPDGRKRPAWARLLPEYLRPLGYRSYHAGKWHLDSTPVKCGFDRSYALLDYDFNFSPRHHELDGKPLPPVKLERGLLFDDGDHRPGDRILEGASGEACGSAVLRVCGVCRAPLSAASAGR